jgi:hypothetical protein
MPHDSAVPRGSTPVPPSTSRGIDFHVLWYVTWSVISTRLNTTELSPQSMLVSKTSNMS